MLNRFRQRTLSLLLSALVLTWGTVPPGIQHAHVGGSDSTHRHDHCHEVAHHDSHDHGSHHHDSHGEDHKHATVSDVCVLSDFVAHVHLRWLGIQLSLPVPEDPADGDAGDSVPVVIVLSVDQTVPPTGAGPSFSRVFLAAICAPSADVVRPLAPIPRPPNLVMSIPLCDSARLERSGVLLV